MEGETRGVSVGMGVPDAPMGNGSRPNIPERVKEVDEGAVLQDQGN